MSRWLAVLIMVFVLSTMASGWTTTWLVWDRAQEGQERREALLEAIHGQQLCIAEMLWVPPPERRQLGFTPQEAVERCREEGGLLEGTR